METVENHNAFKIDLEILKMPFSGLYLSDDIGYIIKFFKTKYPKEASKTVKKGELEAHLLKDDSSSGGSLDQVLAAALKVVQDYYQGQSDPKGLTTYADWQKWIDTVDITYARAKTPFLFDTSSSIFDFFGNDKVINIYFEGNNSTILRIKDSKKISIAAFQIKTKEEFSKIYNLTDSQQVSESQKIARQLHIIKAICAVTKRALTDFIDISTDTEGNKKEKPKAFIEDTVFIEYGSIFEKDMSDIRALRGILLDNLSSKFRDIKVWKNNFPGYTLELKKVSSDSNMEVIECTEINGKIIPANPVFQFAHTYKVDIKIAPKSKKTYSKGFKDFLTVKRTEWATCRSKQDPVQTSTDSDWKAWLKAAKNSADPCTLDKPKDPFIGTNEEFLASHWEKDHPGKKAYQVDSKDVGLNIIGDYVKWLGAEFIHRHDISSTLRIKISDAYNSKDSILPNEFPLNERWKGGDKKWKFPNLEERVLKVLEEFH